MPRRGLPAAARAICAGNWSARSAAFWGVPYRWGGEDRQNGFDCSGLTMVSYRLNGLNLPRNSRAQFQAGRSVAKKNLQQGDLVFFATKGGTRGDPRRHVHRRRAVYSCAADRQDRPDRQPVEHVFQKNLRGGQDLPVEKLSNFLQKRYFRPMPRAFEPPSSATSPNASERWCSLEINSRFGHVGNGAIDSSSIQ